MSSRGRSVWICLPGPRTPCRCRASRYMSMRVDLERVDAELAEEARRSPRDLGDVPVLLPVPALVELRRPAVAEPAQLAGRLGLAVQVAAPAAGAATRTLRRKAPTGGRGGPQSGRRRTPATGGRGARPRRSRMSRSAQKRASIRAAGSATSTPPVPRTLMALSLLEPQTPPKPPCPNARAGIVLDRGDTAEALAGGPDSEHGRGLVAARRRPPCR